ncbi:hypothetical protein KKH43_02625 [Patescibacteria group bacterium]|nr:hypothetical protein [Patescibacteria group bacterium]
MDITFVALTINIIGEVLIAYVVLRVHHKMLIEHKFDKKVFDEIRREQKLVFLGIALIIISFVLEVVKNWEIL